MFIHIYKVKGNLKSKKQVTYDVYLDELDEMLKVKFKCPECKKTFTKPFSEIIEVKPEVIKDDCDNIVEHTAKLSIECPNCGTVVGISFKE